MACIIMLDMHMHPMHFVQHEALRISLSEQPDRRSLWRVGWNVPIPDQQDQAWDFEAIVGELGNYRSCHQRLGHRK